MPRKPTDPNIRFDRYVQPNGQCLLWIGARKKTTGYGSFRVKVGIQMRAHRFAYERAFGPIPPEMTLDHLCRNPSCVTPLHLEAVPIRVNVLRGDGCTARNAKKEYCKRGHPFDQINTVRVKFGRACKECNRLRTQAYRARKKEASCPLNS